MPHYAIRPCLPADLEGLLALERQNFRSDRLTARRFRHWLQADNGILLGASAGGELAGYLLVFSRRRGISARIYSLAVNPAHRGRGIATLLIQAAQSWAQQRGLARLQLEVAVDNAGAIQLYRKLGFHLLGHRPGYYEDGTDALRLVKELPAATHP